MKTETDYNGEHIITEVFNGVQLRSENSEEFNICMRDTGFEFNYYGVHYEAKEGTLKKMGVTQPDTTLTQKVLEVLKHESTIIEEHLQEGSMRSRVIEEDDFPEVARLIVECVKDGPHE